MVKLDCSSKLFNETQWKKNVDLEKQLGGGGERGLNSVKIPLTAGRNFIIIR